MFNQLTNNPPLNIATLFRMMEKEIMVEQPKKLYTLANLLNEGLIELDELAAIIPGILHINNREDLAIDYLSNQGLDIIHYSNEELKTMGAKVFEKHQSEFTMKTTYPKLIQKIKDGDPDHVIHFTQDWQRNKDEKPFYFYTSTKILNENQVISISLMPQKLEFLSTSVNDIFGINRIFDEYFERFTSLTKREKDVLKLLGKELSRKEIAEILFITDGVVKKHCEHIFKKLNTSKRTELEKIAKAFFSLY